MLFRRECARMDSYGENEDEAESVEMAHGGLGEVLSGPIDENAEDRVLQLLKRKSYLLYRLQKVKCKQARQALARKQSVASFGSWKGAARRKSLTSSGAPQAGVGGERISSTATGASRPDLHKVYSAAQLVPPGFHRVVTEGGYFHAPTSPARGPHAPASLTGGPSALGPRGAGVPANLHTLQNFKTQPAQQIKDEDHDRYSMLNIRYEYNTRILVRMYSSDFTPKLIDLQNSLVCW